VFGRGQGAATLTGTMPTSVFAYGSLALLPRPATEHQLTGFARTWNVAMDNRVDLPGYKFYADPHTGQRPDIYVAFLNVVPSPGSAVNGVVIDVTHDELALIDSRERNYDRVEVTAHVTPRPAGEVYAYVGSAPARRRFSRGLREGSCTVDATYLDAVRDGFAALGAGALERFEQSTASPPCPVRPLLRHDLDAIRG
jgi:hypothetical protein